MKVGGNAARAFSILVETNDKLNLFNALTALLLNGIVTGQVLFYPGAGATKKSSKEHKPAKVNKIEAKESDYSSSSPTKKVKKVKRD
jgi:hypothetical protein